MVRPTKTTGAAESGVVFGRLGDLIVQRPLVFIGFWVVLAAGLMLTSPSLAKVARERPVPNLPSSAPAVVAARQMADAFGDPGSPTTLLVVLTDDKGLGPADERAYGRLVDALRRDTQDVVALTDFFHAPALRDSMTSKDHRAWYLPVGLAGELGSARLHHAYDRVAETTADTLTGSRLTANMAGPPATDADLADIGARHLGLIEAVTAVLVFGIVLVVYRNPITALLPVLSTGVSVVAAQSIVALLGQRGLAVSDQAVALMTATVCGAGAGYAAVLVSRYQDHVRLGNDSDQAVIKALTSVGTVISLSAVTVAAAFLGMTFTSSAVFNTVGPAAAIAIGVAFIAAVTLLPAMLAVAGSRGWIAPRQDVTAAFWRRWGMRIVRRPRLYLLAGLTLLIILAIGARPLRESYDDRTTLPDSAPSSAGYAALQSHFPVGSTIGEHLVVQTPDDLRTTEGRAALQRMAQRLSRMPDIALLDNATQLPAVLPAADAADQAGAGGGKPTDAFPSARGLLDSLAGASNPSGADTPADDAARLTTTMRALGFGMATDLLSIVSDSDGTADPAPDPNCQADSCSDPRLVAVSDDETLSPIGQLASQLQSTPDAQTVESATQSLQAARRTVADARQSLSIDDVAGVPKTSGTLQDSAEALADEIRQLLDEVQALLDQRNQTHAGLTEGSTFVVSPDGRAARYAIQTRRNPFSTAAMNQLTTIVDTARGPKPDLALADSTLSMAGVPAALRDTRDYGNRDVRFIIAVTIVVVLLISIARLRAIVAPLYLIGTVLLSYLSALGIGVVVFQRIIGQQLQWSVVGLTFVTIMAVGADHGMVLISRMRDCPGDVRSGVVRSLGSIGGLVTAAGLIFAASAFALLLAGVGTLAQAGFLLGAGLLLNAFVVRITAVPALAMVVGRANWWPSRRREQSHLTDLADTTDTVAARSTAAAYTGEHPMLELARVCKTYRVGGQSVRALDKVTSAFSCGQFVSVVGPSGSGKSTLLHLLGALDRPDSGSIRFQGKEIGELDDYEQSEFRRRSVGFVFQSFNLLPTMSAWENVAVPMLLDGARMSKAKSRALELLSLVGLADRAEHRPSELSGGQMQRVAIARALMMDPPLVLADEPTGNLDTQTGAAIMALLNDVAHQQGRCVVMVTHNLEAAASTDRVITLTDGRIGSDVVAAEEHP